jgi:hypothetical protein
MPRRPHAAAAVAATIVLLTAGCASAPARPAAEVAADGPDCLAADVLTDLGMVPPTGHTRTGPEAGSVPDGFTPVSVVRCGGAFLLGDVAPPVLLTPAPETLEDLGAGAVDLEDALATPAAPAEPTPEPRSAPVTVQVSELRGDLGPLLDQLARPSQAPREGEVCMAMMELRPVIFLVDADGRAVRAQWPSTSCGFLLDGATAPLDALEVVSTTEQTLVVG